VKEVKTKDIDGKDTISYSYDEYRLERGSDPGIEDRIKGNVKVWLDLAKKDEEDKLIKEFEAERFKLLSATDWTRADDIKMSPAKKKEYADYREALRAIPQTQENFPYNIVWPKPPKQS